MDGLDDREEPHGLTYGGSDSAHFAPLKKRQHLISRRAGFHPARRLGIAALEESVTFPVVSHRVPAGSLRCGEENSRKQKQRTALTSGECRHSLPPGGMKLKAIALEDP